MTTSPRSWRAIEYGRATFGNIRRFLTYHLTDNVAELTPFVVWALSGGRFPLALGVLQVLALDIGTDTLPAVALGAEPPAPRTLGGPPLRGRLLDRTVAVRALGIAGPIEAISMAAFVISLVVAGWRPGASFPAGEALLAPPAPRSRRSSSARWRTRSRVAATQPAWRITWSSNQFLTLAVGIEIVALAVALFWTPLASMLGQSAPPAAGWVVALSAVPAVIAADAAFKRVRRAHERGEEARVARRGADARARRLSAEGEEGR